MQRGAAVRYQTRNWRTAPHPIKTMLNNSQIEFLIQGCAKSDLTVLSRDKSKNLANYGTINLAIGAPKNKIKFKKYAVIIKFRDVFIR